MPHCERVLDLLDASLNRSYNMDVEKARRRVLSGDPPSAGLGIDASFAPVARDGNTVRLARSMDRPMRYLSVPTERRRRRRPAGSRDRAVRGAGLGDRCRRDHGPAEDLVAAAGVLGATLDKIGRLLERCGFSTAPARGGTA